MTRFTGWHITGIIAAFFGVVIAVNLVMAMLAVKTFGGTVVDNGYVASQDYNQWLARAKKQAALGWRVTMVRGPSGHVRAEIHMPRGTSIARLTASAVHPLGRLPEQRLNFHYDHGAYRSTRALPEGRWVVRLTILGAQGEAARFTKEFGA